MIIIIVIVVVFVSSVAAAAGHRYHLWGLHHHSQLVRCTSTAAVRKLSASHRGNSEDRTTPTLEITSNSMMQMVVKVRRPSSVHRGTFIQRRLLSAAATTTTTPVTITAVIVHFPWRTSWHVHWSSCQSRSATTACILYICP